jgi:hypothetical protein
MLVPPFHPAADWAESLADNLLHPQFPISVWEALGRRYRRNYMWIYVVLGLAWLFKVGLHPTPVGSWLEFFSRAVVGAVPGWLILALGLIFNGLLLLIGLLTMGLQQASGEVLPRYGIFPFSGVSAETAGGVRGRGLGQRLATVGAAWFRPSHRRQQLMALIVTSRSESGQAVADRILRDMRRGVTALSGTGMYTHQPHNVLMCALTVTEVPHLKALVSAEDPLAFVIVAPVQEVLGKGFVPLKEE